MAKADLSDEGASEAGGFIFSKLIERKPHLKPELLTFRDTLLSSASQEQTLKVRLPRRGNWPRASIVRYTVRVRV